MSPDELVYYRHRAAVERQRAAQAANPHAADVHLRMAVLYERLVQLEQAPQPKVRLVEVMNPRDPSRIFGRQPIRAAASEG